MEGRMDMINGSLGDKIIKYAIPLAVTGVLQQLFNAADLAVVGQFSGKEAMATVLSNLVSSAILFAALMKTEMAIRIEFRRLRVHGDVLAQILKIGIPAGIQGMIFSYYIMNSFGQACTTFVGQNYGAGKGERCLRTLKLSLLQSLISTAAVCGLILLLSRPLLGIFNTGVSFIPAACAVVGICGVRLTWIFTVFRQNPSFSTIMQAYPLSLGVTAAAILAVTLFMKPSRRYVTQ